LAPARDFHRHRRCSKFSAARTTPASSATDAQVITNGLTVEYQVAMDQALVTLRQLPAPANEYLLPFGARSRFLFKMDFAEAEYLCRVHSGVEVTSATAPSPGG
jgi:hypothetical protein